MATDFTKCPVCQKKIGWRSATGIYHLDDANTRVLEATYSVPGTSPDGELPDQTTKFVTVVHKDVEDMDMSDEDFRTAFASDPAYADFINRHPDMVWQAFDFLVPPTRASEVAGE